MQIKRNKRRNRLIKTQSSTISVFCKTLQLTSLAVWTIPTLTIADQWMNWNVHGGRKVSGHILIPNPSHPNSQNQAKYGVGRDWQVTTYTPLKAPFFGLGKKSTLVQIYRLFEERTILVSCLLCIPIMIKIRLKQSHHFTKQLHNRWLDSILKSFFITKGWISFVLLRW